MTELDRSEMVVRVIASGNGWSGDGGGGGGKKAKGGAKVTPLENRSLQRRLEHPDPFT